MTKNQQDGDVVDDILEQWSEERPELDMLSLGVVIRIMSLNRTFAREAGEALAGLELELFEYDVLSALRRQGRPFALKASTLAQETELSTGAMTNRIDRLEARDLVRRKSDRQDRRGVVVSLTAKGKRLIDEAIHLRLESADASLESLNSRDRRQLSSLLRKIRGSE